MRALRERRDNLQSPIEESCMSKPVYIRPLRKDDLSAVVNVEDRSTGVSRREYWEKRIDMYEAIRPYWASIVAEVDNRVVGFLFGRAGELEFGLADPVAWIETIGIDPAYRRQGIAAKLVEHFKLSADEHKIHTVFTLVAKSNKDMEQFFTKVGFAQGQMLHFQTGIKL
jgi:ribosomal protein S18 acetylase RimI-like enzyme